MISQGALRRGVSGAFGLRLARVLNAFLIHLLLTRWLGAAAYGAIAIGLAWAQIAAVLAPLGLDNALLRLIPRYRTRGRMGLLRRLLEASIRIPVQVGMVLGLVVAGAMFWMRGGDLSLALMTGLMVPLATITAVRTAQLRAFGRITPAFLPRAIVEPAVTAALLGLWIRGGGGQGADVGMAALVLGLAVAAVMQSVAIRKESGADVAAGSSGRAARERLRSWIGLSFPMLLVSGSLIASDRVDVLLLGLLSGDEAAGIYAAASRMALFVGFGLTAVNVILAPLVSEGWARRDLEAIQSAISRSASTLAVLVLSISGLLWIFGGWALSLFGAEFVAGLGALQILLIGQTVNGLTGVVGMLLSMTGSQWVVARVLAGTALANAILNLILIPRYGLVGAAVATATTTTVQNLILMVLVRRRLGVYPTVFGALRAR